MSKHFERIMNSLVTEPGKFSDDAELNLKSAAATIGITTRALRTLLESGVLPDLKSSRIFELSRRSVFIPSNNGELIPILRTGDESVDPEDNRPIGYSDTMPDADVVEANRMWWRVDPNKVLRAFYLPVSIAGFNAALLGIDELEDSVTNGREVRHCFKAHLIARYDGASGDVVMKTDNEEDRLVANHLLGHFQKSVSGGPIAYL